MLPQRQPYCGCRSLDLASVANGLLHQATRREQLHAAGAKSQYLS